MSNVTIIVDKADKKIKKVCGTMDGAQKIAKRTYMIHKEDVKYTPQPKGNVQFIDQDKRIVICDFDPNELRKELRNGKFESIAEDLNGWMFTKVVTDLNSIFKLYTNKLSGPIEFAQIDWESKSERLNLWIDTVEQLMPDYVVYKSTKKQDYSWKDKPGSKFIEDSDSNTISTKHNIH